MPPLLPFPCYLCPSELPYALAGVVVQPTPQKAHIRPASIKLAGLPMFYPLCPQSGAVYPCNSCGAALKRHALC
eukprot:1160705-Pelagomonas_calceolata.AAC.17